MVTTAKTTGLKIEAKPASTSTKVSPAQVLTEIDELKAKVSDLEAKMATMESSIQQFLTVDTLITRLTGETANKKPKKEGRHREYSDEERAAIRERLAAGKLAKAKAREAMINS